MEQPVLSISYLEAHHMGMENIWILTTIKAKIEEDYYHALSHTKPTLVQSPEYKALLACVAA